MRASACASPGRAEGGIGRPPPPKKTRRGGETARQHHKGRPNPPPRRHRDRTPKGAQGDHPSETGNTKPGTAAQRGKGHPKRADTHHAGTRKEKEQATQPKREGMGGTGNTRPGTRTASDQHHKAKARNAKKKHGPTTQPRRAGHSRDPGPARTGTQHSPARKGGEQAGRAHKHTPPHSTPNQEVQKTTRDGRTITHTPQHPPKEWRGAAETQAPARTPTVHTGTGNGGVQAERARNHARPISATTKGGVQAETQAQPRTAQTPAGKRGTTPQTVPKHTRPRPQPGLAGLPKPTPNRNPDPNTSTTQQ